MLFFGNFINKRNCNIFSELYMQEHVREEIVSFSWIKEGGDLYSKNLLIIIMIISLLIYVNTVFSVIPNKTKHSETTLGNLVSCKFLFRTTQYFLHFGFYLSSLIPFKPLSGQCPISIPPENVRKPEAFWRFHGV